jgi:hypothetical protein
LEYDINLEFCHKYSRGTSKTRKGPRDMLARTGNISRSGVTKEEIGNMLKDFKINVLSSLSSQLDTLQIKKKHEEIEQALAIFFPKCRKKHLKR